METLNLNQAFKHSYTREFGSHHVNKDGTERTCTVFNVLNKNINISFIYIELDSDKKYIVYANREFFEPYMAFKKFETKKEAIKYAETCYNNYLTNK